MIEISEPIEYFQSCNGCGRYNKRGPGVEAMYKSLCKNIRTYIFYDRTCVRLCEDCARELRDRLNELLETDTKTKNMSKEEYREALIEELKKRGATPAELNLVSDEIIINALNQHRSVESVAWAILQ